MPHDPAPPPLPPNGIAPGDETGPGGGQADPAPERRQAPRWPGVLDGIFLYLGILLLLALGGGSLATLESLDVRWATIVSQLAFLLVPTLLALRWWREDPRRFLRLRPIRPSVALLSMACTILLLPVLWGLLAALVQWVPGADALEEAILEVLRVEGAGEWALVMTAAVAVPAVCEELLFRGLLLSVFRRRMGTGAALGLQALLFGLIHVHPLRIVPTLLLGLLLGWLALRTRSILAPIMGHAAFNALIVVTAQVPAGEAEAAAPDPGATALVSGIGLILLAAALTGLWMLTRPSAPAGPTSSP